MFSLLCKIYRPFYETLGYLPNHKDFHADCLRKSTILYDMLILFKPIFFMQPNLKCYLCMTYDNRLAT